MAALAACHRAESRPVDYTYAAPRARSDGISVANAATVGVDTSRIKELVRPFAEGRRGHHTSLLVMKDGKLIIEEYFDGWKADRRHTVQSVSKSITSLMIGYALAKGFIGSIDDPIAKHLPKYRHLLTGGKEKITIRHLLTMTSGLEWNEGDLPYSDARNIRIVEYNSPDGVAFVLSRPLSSQPGEVWSYNGGGMTILGEILRNASGQSHERLIERAFAGLLDRDEIRPAFQKDGRMNAAGGFEVTPRGMVKIGQMVLQDGMWNGEAMFDRHWIKESTDAIVGRGRTGYGYLWWRRSVRVDDRLIETIEANGYGGQRILIFPDLRLVVVVTAMNFENPTPVDSIVEHGVLPAVGPFHLTTGRLIRPLTTIDSPSAYPRSRGGWSEVVADTLPGGGGATIRLSVDTLSGRRLDDGSWLVWLRSVTSKPRFEGAQPYDRVVSRFVLRCESPTDGRFKRVSTTLFNGNSPPIFQDIVGLDSARGQPWVPASARGLDINLFRRACALMTTGRGQTTKERSLTSPAGAVRVADCSGPATSLPDSLLRALPPRTGRMHPDDHWADLAASVPGGFAGVVRGEPGTPVLLLTHPESASAAKAALKLTLALDNSTVRPARWDFGQLVNWFNYLMPRLGEPVTADKDEMMNRIHFGVTSVAARDRVVRSLQQLHLPCDLVVVDLTGLGVRIR